MHSHKKLPPSSIHHFPMMYRNFHWNYYRTKRVTVSATD